MTARDDYPRMCGIAGDRLHHHGGLYEADGHEIITALDEIDRLRDATFREALVIQPGDTLIVRIATDRVTQDLMVQIKRAVIARLPQLADVLVITADEIAVYRPNVEGGDAA